MVPQYHTRMRFITRKTLHNNINNIPNRKALLVLVGWILHRYQARWVALQQQRHLLPRQQVRDR